MQSIVLNYITEDDVSLNSYLYLPNDENNDVENLPAVLLFPEWWGLTEHIKDKAKALAKAGYVALAVDMYGNGRVTSDAQIANERMGELLQHPDLLLERVQLAYNNLRAVAEVNPNKMAALGFCFGGRVVLDMARDGMDLCGVVSFHGMLNTQTPAQKGAVKAEILVEHGELDSMCTLQNVDEFRTEMDAADVKYHIDVFPDTKHGFTNPQATENGKRNRADLAYNPVAAEQAWNNALTFLTRVLKA